MGDIDTYELDWEKADSLLPIPEYSGPSPRPTFDKPDCTQLSIFSKIFDDEVWQFITDYTNVYAEVFHTAKPEYFTTSGHLYRLESSSATLPWSSPWGLSSCRELLTTGSKNIRVSGCLEYRTLCQETGSRQSPGTSIYQTGPRNRHVVQRIMTNFTKSENSMISWLGNISPVDKAMIPFKGSIGFRQYMKKKTNEMGHKGLDTQ
ncbi:uncharacterized protein LOC134181371 [Corticium candelabrum]|uniref:uncharacterized protein LOC134181371 n=1 Tax=Corticium candelabrum TaxID=121492 RepID=UPI002E26A074|nr:uncharacterized protein LOC134181371 [Corticium candelabrum]